MFVQSPIDKYASILEDTNTLIGLPPYLAGQRSSTSPQGGFLSAATLVRAFFLPAISDAPGVKMCLFQIETL